MRIDKFLSAAKRRRNPFGQLSPLALAVLALGICDGAAAAGIVADGTTATSVSTDAAGKASVAIAPPVAGVSYNAYSRFDVAKAGADLINAGVNARYIVNEVTSAAPTSIEGPLSVIGPRANLILANPNGITVNGGELLNFGSVALTTSKVGFNDFNPAPGVLQRNVVLTTDRGTIEIGPQGLSGALINLDLVAKQLRVNGPVANRFDSASARLRVIAGSSRAQFDTSVSPTDNLNEWAAYTNPGVSSDGATLVDITPLGALSAGRIQIAVTEAGAGVRHAGVALATLGDFTLSAGGEVKLEGATVQAARDVIATATTLQAHVASVIGARDVDVRAGSITLTGGRIVAGDESPSGATGPRMPSGAGAVLIESDGDLRNSGGLIRGSAVTLGAAGSVINETPLGGPLAVVFGAAGDVLVRAQGDIVNHGGRLISNRNLTLNAGGDVSNGVDRVGGIGEGSAQHFRERQRNLFGISKRSAGFSVDYGDLASTGAQAVLVADGGLTITGRDITNRGGELIANGGDIRLAAAERIRNEGLATGQVRFERSCRLFVCRTRADGNVSVVGGLLSASRDVELHAGAEIENHGGRVLALRAMTLDAPRVSARSVTVYSVIKRAAGLKALFGDSWAQVYAADQGGAFTASRGRLRIIGTAFNDGGVFAAVEGIDAAGGIVTVRSPRRDPVRLDDHIGLTSWLWK